jgi:hypothetical protein
VEKQPRRKAARVDKSVDASDVKAMMKAKG